MSLIKQIINDAKKGGYAVGTFDTNNLEITQGIARAAVAKDFPALIGVTENALEYAGFDALVALIRGVISESKAKLVLHLDHGKHSDNVIKCIDAGFESVMIDASAYDFEKNVEITKEIVKYGHKKGVFIQAELGKIPKLDSSVEVGVALSQMEKTEPDEAEEFVKKTKVDTLAVIIGNIHGGYKGKENPRLDFDLLKKIREKVSTPFVLHGGSGVPVEDVKRAISEFGIVNVNIDTQIRVAFIEALKNFFASGEQTTDPRKFMSIARDNVQKAVEEKIELFRNR
ncbi:MAG: class II fructose-bisphosphate aldolase [Candidatus Paceibacterota bacterium]|jgi:fructose-bisphosphate aldolase class II